MAKHKNQAGWNTWSLPIRIGIAAAACLIIAKDLDWGALKATFAELELWTLAVGIAAFAASQWLIGLRWWVFLQAQRIAVPLGTAIKLTFLGLFFSNFLPSSVGGDLVRAWYVSRLSSRKLQAALGVLVDRIMGLSATLILAISSLIVVMRSFHILRISRIERTFSPFQDISTPHLILVGVMIAGIVLLFIKPLKSLLKRTMRHALDILRQLRQVIGVYYHHPFVLLWGLLLTLLLQSMVITAYWRIGLDLGITASLGYYFVFFPVVWLIGSIPVSIAGLGILEGGIVFLFVRYAGATPEAAAALAVCQRLTWLIASVPGLYIHLAGTHRHPEKPVTIP